MHSLQSQEHWRDRHERHIHIYTLNQTYIQNKNCSIKRLRWIYMFTWSSHVFLRNVVLIRIFLFLPWFVRMSYLSISLLTTVCMASCAWWVMCGTENNPLRTPRITWNCICCCALLSVCVLSLYISLFYKGITVHCCRRSCKQVSVTAYTGCVDEPLTVLSTFCCCCCCCCEFVV